MRKLVLMPEVSGTDYSRPDDLFFKIFMDLPPEVTAFYCSRDFAVANPQLINLLDEKRIRVRVNTTDGLNSESLVVVGSTERFNPSERYNEIKSLGVKTVYYLPPTEELGHSPEADEFIFYTSEKQLLFSAVNPKYALNEKGDLEAAITAKGGQGAAIGVWRNEDVLAFGKKKRPALRKQLAELTGFSFNESLPLMFYSETYHQDPQPFNHGFLRLADKSNILIKDLSFESHLFKYPLAQIPKSDNIFVFDKSSINYLARYAADVTLSIAFGGFLTTSIMIGARTIPIYTQKIFPWASFYNERRQVSFTNHLQNSLMALPARIMDYLTPLSIENTEAILDRMNDEAYWKRYEQLLPEIHSYVFGNFAFGEKVYNRAMSFILRYLKYGSFIVDGQGDKIVSSVRLANMPPSSPL